MTTLLLTAALRIWFSICDPQGCREIGPPAFKLHEGPLDGWSRIENVQGKSFYFSTRNSGQALHVFVGTQGGDSTEAKLENWFDQSQPSPLTLRGPRSFSSDVLIIPYLRVERLPAE